MTAALRITRRGVLPALALLALALISGGLRVAALVAFGAAAVAHVGFTAVEAAGEALPRPHWNPCTPRPVPAPEVSAQ